MMTPENFSFGGIIADLNANGYTLNHLRTFSGLIPACSLKDGQKLLENLDNGRSRRPEEFKAKLKQAYFDFYEHMANKPEPLSWGEVRLVCNAYGISGAEFTKITGVRYRYHAERATYKVEPGGQEIVRAFLESLKAMPMPEIITVHEPEPDDDNERVSESTRMKNYNKLQKWVNEQDN